MSCSTQNNGASSSDSSSCPDACSSLFSRLNEYCSGDPHNYGNWYLKDESDPSASLFYLGATSSGYSSGTVFAAASGNQYTLVTCGCETNTTAVIGLATGGAALFLILISVALYLFVCVRRRSEKTGDVSPSFDTSECICTDPPTTVAGIPIDFLEKQLEPAAGQVVVTIQTEDCPQPGHLITANPCEADIVAEASHIPTYVGDLSDEPGRCPLQPEGDATVP